MVVISLLWNVSQSLILSYVFSGPSLDAEKDLSALCQLWIDSKDLVVKVPSQQLTIYGKYLN